MEHVYTVTDYYDGPRRGVADFKGTPHAFTSVFDDSEDDWESTFLLRPVDQDTLRLVLEDWKIWERWRKAFDEGTATIESHPALPQDRQRHEQIKPILGQALKIEPTTKLRARGRFEVIDGEWKVEWS